MKVKHICFITGGYPTSEDPVFTFVRQLIASIANQGIKCSVISPQSVTRSLIRGGKLRPYHWKDITSENSVIDIYQPRFFSISNSKIGNISFTHFFWKKAIIKTFYKLHLNPDVLYGHFWHSGFVSAIIGKDQSIPVFVASGESKISVLDVFRNKLVYKYMQYINGVISVSTENMQESIQLKLANRNKIKVIPNAVDTQVFYPENKSEMRNMLGYSQNDFIVAFTGAFTERKGVLRLSEAVQEIGDIKSIFIGSGPLKPENDGILFCGKLPHDQIRKYLNAADVFVLPTIAEGCSNAIVEAMACGLPIISSDQAFNNDILNEKNSIRVDSNNIEEIVKGIRFLKNNINLRREMANASAMLAKEFDIKDRAKKIINYIENET